MNIIEKAKTKLKNSLGEEFERPVTAALIFVGSAIILNIIFPKTVVHRVNVHISEHMSDPKIYHF